jgi:hypothetical protein
MGSKKCFNLECFKEKYFNKYPDSKIELLEFLPDEKIKIKYQDTIKIVNRYYLYKGRKYIKNSFYLKNTESILDKLNIHIKNNNLKIKVLEILEKGKFKYKDEFGECIFDLWKIYKNKKPRIHAAINKTDYFINQVKKIYGNKYNYDEVVYIKSSVKIKVYCNKHKEYFYPIPSNHLKNKGCSKCGDESGGLKNAIHSTGWTYTNWEKAGLKSKKFDGFKVYIIKCWNDNEEFYKIGKTFKTVKNRFHSTKLPYNYKILKIIKNEPKNICELENKLKNENKNFKYTPKNKFCGASECYSKINNLDEIIFT